jgi:hypothetical protein
MGGQVIFPRLPGEEEILQLFRSGVVVEYGFHLSVLIIGLAEGEIQG